jgi:hypothetical protein
VLVREWHDEHMVVSYGQGWSTSLFNNGICVEGSFCWRQGQDHRCRTDADAADVGMGEASEVVEDDIDNCLLGDTLELRLNRNRCLGDS